MFALIFTNFLNVFNYNEENISKSRSRNLKVSSVTEIKYFKTKLKFKEWMV